MTPAPPLFGAGPAAGSSPPLSQPAPGGGTYTWEADCYGSWLLAVRVFRLRLLLERGERDRAEQEAREYGVPLEVAE